MEKNKSRIAGNASIKVHVSAVSCPKHNVFNRPGDGIRIYNKASSAAPFSVLML